MAQLPISFDTNNEQAQEPFELLPAAWYGCTISNSEVKPTKDGAGQYLQVNFRVGAGPRAGSTIVDRFNLVNKNADAVRIAKQQLASLCKAAGFTGVLDDSSKLHGQHVDVLVKVRPPQGEYGPNNDVKGYAPAGERSQSPASLAAQGAEPPTFDAPGASSASTAGYAAPPPPQAQAAPAPAPQAAPAPPPASPPQESGGGAPAPWAR